MDYGVKSVRFGPTKVRINLFDLAGGQEFLSVRNEFYKDTQGGILVFDVTNRDSFDALNAWVEESCSYGAKNPEIFVVANKIEMLNRVISEVEARSWAEDNGFDWTFIPGRRPILPPSTVLAPLRAGATTSTPSRRTPGGWTAGRC